MKSVYLNFNSNKGMELTLPQKYKEYADVFSEQKAFILLKDIKIAYTILIKEDKKILYRPIYPLIANKLKVLRDYFKTNLVKE